MTTEPKVYVIHENPEWLPPLREAFERLGTPYEEWLLDQHVVDLSEAPPEGVFFSRMSASNYTRGHAHSNHSTDIVLRWLEAHGRRVINGSSVLRLEFSKAAQQIALDRAGFTTPRTVVAIGRARIIEAAERSGLSTFILKPNQGGKGLGVQYFDSATALRAAIPALPEAPDDVWLVQERIATTDEFITRAEFVGARFIYAVQVYSGGSFELCPADVCEVDFTDFCPAEANADAAAPAPVATPVAPPAGPRFEIAPEVDRPLMTRIERFLTDNGIEVAGVEFIRRPDGTPVIYDVNTNTNYNSGAEKAAGIARGGMAEIARFLTGELARLTAPEARERRA